jgi:hypothetical protein
MFCVSEKITIEAIDNHKLKAEVFCEQSFKKYCNSCPDPRNRVGVQTETAGDTPGTASSTAAAGCRGTSSPAAAAGGITAAAAAGHRY